MFEICMVNRYSISEQRGRGMNKKRCLDILNNLSTEEAITSEELGVRLSLSSRTVRNELKELKGILEKEGAHLISKTNSGYLISIENQEKYRNFLRMLEGVNMIPETSDERIQYLFEELLQNNEKYVKLDDLAEQLYISKSSLTANLKEVRRLLAAYNLQLVTRPGYGLRIEGKEFDFRHCLAAHITNQKKTDEFQKIAECVEQGLEGSDFKINEMSYQNLVVHIYIALRRNQDSIHTPLQEEQLEQIAREVEFVYAQKIAGFLEKTFSTKLSRAETGYIAVHLAGKRMVGSMKHSGNLVIDDEIYGLVNRMLDVIQENYHMDFHDDLELRMFLAAHMVPFSVRMQYGMKLKNPLLQEIKSHYSLAYMMAVTACEVLEQHFRKKMSDDEIGYFALPISLAMERRQTKVARKNIVVVCATGRGSAQILVYRLKNEFGKYLNQIEICDVLELKGFDFTNIDYVITTVPIPFSINRPILQIKLFLENADVHALQNLLTGKDGPVLKKYFHRDMFLAGLKAANKQEVITKMVEQIRRVKKIPGDFEQAVFERERLAVTEFGNLVAIPHPNRALTDETFVCIAVLQAPIYWDEQRVQFVLMLSLQKDGCDDMQKLSSTIAKILFSRECINEIIKKPTFDTFIKLLEAMERNNS